MTYTELEEAAKAGWFVNLSAQKLKDLLDKSQHVAKTEDKMLGGDQKARLSLLTITALEDAELAKL